AVEDLGPPVAVEVRDRDAEPGADVAGAVVGGLAGGGDVHDPGAVYEIGDDHALGEVHEGDALEPRVVVEVGEGEVVAAVAVDGDRRLDGEGAAVEHVDDAGGVV